MLPLDLHVLGLSLAFILSQDQTLRCIILFYIFTTRSYITLFAQNCYVLLFDVDFLVSYYFLCLL